MLQLLLQREIGSSVSEPVPEFSEEQAIEADSNAYDDLRPLVSAGGTDWDGDLPAGLYVVGRTCPRAPTRSSAPRTALPWNEHLVNDACGVEIYEDLSAYDAADSELDDVRCRGYGAVPDREQCALFPQPATRRSMTCPPILPPTR